jgi:hypothetical protein
MKDIDSITAKVKKLFALAKSPNPEEAASALRKAQELIAAYGLTAKGLDMPEMTKRDVVGNSMKKPPDYEYELVSEVARSCGCRCAYGYCGLKNYYSPTYGFETFKAQYGYTIIGLEYRVEIVSYMVVVLLRKLRTARRNYIASLKRVKTRKQKIIRADKFCEGWVQAVCCNLDWLESSDDEIKKLNAYEKEQGWGNNLETISRELKRHTGDYDRGIEEGRDIHVNKAAAGVGASRPLIGSSYSTSRTNPAGGQIPLFG